MIGARRVWTARPDGTDAHNITDDPSYSDAWAGWSKDSSRIVFARTKAADIQGYGIRSGASPELWLVNADGSDKRKVLEFASATAGAYYGFIYWDQLFDWYRG